MKIQEIEKEIIKAYPYLVSHFGADMLDLYRLSIHHIQDLNAPAKLEAKMIEELENCRRDYLDLDDRIDVLFEKTFNSIEAHRYSTTDEFLDEWSDECEEITGKKFEQSDAFTLLKMVSDYVRANQEEIWPEWCADFLSSEQVGDEDDEPWEKAGFWNFV